MDTWDSLYEDEEIKSRLSLDTQSNEGWLKGENGYDLLGSYKSASGTNVFLCRHLTGARGKHRITADDAEKIREAASKIF